MKTQCFLTLLARRSLAQSLELEKNYKNTTFFYVFVDGGFLLWISFGQAMAGSPGRGLTTTADPEEELPPLPQP